MRSRALASLLVSSISAIILTAALAPSAQAATIVFDSLSGVEDSIGLIGTNPRTFVGEGINIADPGVPVQITALEFFAVFPQATIGTTYQNIEARVQFWNTSNNGNAGTADVFSSPAGGVRTQDYGAYTVTAPVTGGPNKRELVHMDFAAPISLTGLTNLGVTINMLGDTGSGLQSTNNISIGIRGGPDPTVGAFTAYSDPALTGGTPMTGYYRNASGRTDFNFNGSDFRFLVFNGSPTPSGVGMRIFAVSPTVVPEPSALGLLALGGVALIVRRRRRA